MPNLRVQIFRLLRLPAVLLLFSGITGFLLKASDPWTIRVEKVLAEPASGPFEEELFEVFRGDIAETISKEVCIPETSYQIETTVVPAGTGIEAGDLMTIKNRRVRILSVRKGRDLSSGLLVQYLPAQEISFSFPVECRFCNKLSGHLPATVSTGSFQLTGHITGIGALAEEETVLTVISFFDGMILTRPGMKVTVDIVTEEKKDVLLVPAECIFFDARKNAFAMLNTENGIEEIQVETGIADDSFIEILSGLKEGDLVCRTGS